jgi:chemotaxis protein CheD
LFHHVDKKVFIHPGEVFFSDVPAHVHTLLGSCISITLWHPELRIGGMCHFTLPCAPSYHERRDELDGRYADDVMKIFKFEATKRRTTLGEYQAKIFGGGNMIRSAGDCVENTVGTKNAAAAMRLLVEEEVEVKVAHVGEFGHRRIVFDVNSGEVWVRHIEKEDKKKTALNGVI